MVTGASGGPTDGPAGSTATRGGSAGAVSWSASATPALSAAASA